MVSNSSLTFRNPLFSHLAVLALLLSKLSSLAFLIPVVRFVVMVSLVANTPLSGTVGPSLDVSSLPIATLECRDVVVLLVVLRPTNGHLARHRLVRMRWKVGKGGTGARCSSSDDSSS